MSKPGPDRQKARLRIRARAQRQTLAEGDRSDFDRRIRHHLESRIRQIDARTLAAFLSFDGEPDLAPALGRLFEEGRIVALPVIDRSQAGKMTMHAWEPGSDMQANDFGIPEPMDGAEMSAGEIDLVLLPLVAYDRRGTRLGMGQGYYDRWLGQNGSGAPGLKVGVAYSRQQIPGLPREAWDVPMDAIVTEQGWFTFPL